MKVWLNNAGNQIWIRDQTARIHHRYILSGKHFRPDIDALLSRIAQLRALVDTCAVMERKAA